MLTGCAKFRLFPLAILLAACTTSAPTTEVDSQPAPASVETQAPTPPAPGASAVSTSPALPQQELTVTMTLFFDQSTLPADLARAGTFDATHPFIRVVVVELSHV
ncbi:MAG: hypothetical protein EHM35_06520, partial [Planctomycetaceae bacterium]